MATPTYDSIDQSLAARGLLLRGGFHPDGAGGEPDGAGTILMVGNAGPALWAAFSRQQAGNRDPLDQWTKDTAGPLAEKYNGYALYPSDGPPYWPFQAWAQKADNVTPSPIGILIHPDFGLWHAYRAAIVLPDRIDVPAKDNRPPPCGRCAEKPCLTACPVNAFAPGAYDVSACAAHAASAAGTDCRALGCAARRACPVGTPYAPAQAAFHMAAFLKNFSPG